jgi:phage major head subunit gpT-like protein
MILNAQTATALYANLKKEFQKGIEEVKPVCKPLIESVPSDGAYNLYGWLGHIPGFKEWFANQPRVVRNIEEKSFSVSNRKFEDTIGVPIDNVSDNQIGSFGSLAKSMGAAGELLMDELVFELFNNGFSTQLGYDGLSWFNDAHPLGESTIDNRTNLPLTADNFETVYTAIRSFTVKPDKLSKARPLNPSGKYVLVCGPTLEMTARGILEIALLTNGGTNKLFHLAEILVSSYITSTTAWFLVNVGAATKPVFFQDREKLAMLEKTPVNDTTAFNYDQLIYGAKRRCAALPTYPWLAYGSSGDAT